jgi:mycothiol synthase
MDTNTQATKQPTTLPPGFTERSATANDAAIIAGLMNVYDLITIGQADTSLDALREYWHSHSVNPAQDIWLLFSPDGKLVGLEECQDSRKNGRIHIDGYVHPEYAGRGIGTYLLHWAENRAQEYIRAYANDVRISILANTYAADKKSLELLNNEGYKPVRHFWRMEIKMDAPPPAPDIPDGIAIRSFVRGQDERATYEAGHEAFLDHWNYSQVPFEQWISARTGFEGFDPSLWFLAVEQSSNKVVGISLCKFRAENAPWIATLGVIPSWRKRGLGMALLRHTFTEFYNRGYRTVGLGVDAANPTGATRLYERAGMQCAVKFEAWEKELRTGRQL